jgi:rod shape-determining protein MreD
MKEKKILILFLIILFTVLQSTIINYIQILSIKPDILLILVVFLSLHYGQICGLTTGAICGLLMEATSGISTGTAVFAYALGGLFLGYFGKWIYNQRVIAQINITFMSSLFIYLFLFLLFQSFKDFTVNLSLFRALVYIILPTSIYTTIFSLPFFRFLKKTFNVR